MAENDLFGRLTARAKCGQVTKPPRSWRRTVRGTKLRLVRNAPVLILSHSAPLQPGRAKMPASSSSPPSDDRRAPGMLDRSLQAQLGRQLRGIFQDVAEEPVPQRFIDLLDSLADKEEQAREESNGTFERPAEEKNSQTSCERLEEKETKR
jgi:hypothetical protein